jgi:hypothetical protein
MIADTIFRIQPRLRTLTLPLWFTREKKKEIGHFAIEDAKIAGILSGYEDLTGDAVTVVCRMKRGYHFHYHDDMLRDGPPAFGIRTKEESKALPQPAAIALEYILMAPSRWILWLVWLLIRFVCKRFMLKYIPKKKT